MVRQVAFRASEEEDGDEMLPPPESRRPVNPYLRVHWRPSINALLASWNVLRRLPAISPGHEEPTQITSSGYLLFPDELHHMVGEYLDPADRRCLVQTCTELRNAELRNASRISEKSMFGRPLDPISSHKLRRRLDRDDFPMLCSLELTDHPDENMLACNFCLSLHHRRRFSRDQRNALPWEGDCLASTPKHLICGKYHASAYELRAILDGLISPETNLAAPSVQIHHTPQQERDAAFLTESPGTAFSSLVEPAVQPEDLSPGSTAFELSPEGLVFTHRFSSHNYMFERRRAQHRKHLSTPICAHHTYSSAKEKLDLDWTRQEPVIAVANCDKEGCRTWWEWKDDPKENSDEDEAEAVDDGEVYDCLTVKRHAGWVEQAYLPSLDEGTWGGLAKETVEKRE
ncbi:uncharacterized protein LTR77_004765 [Saxophila tyrrhenica]|uniref:F-box domain-containing protein n=1 Tax=Saxophila tyrrhenica TaxID=1690608 RepID=A0AAV9PD75_9PEZI|nr:hypothetical protein LTR77_004765 [Saxophila tyrrhenica]